jgi:hypothetical protein
VLRVIAGNAYKFHIKYSFSGLENLYKSFCLCISIPELMPENQPRDVIEKCTTMQSVMLPLDESLAGVVHNLFCAGLGVWQIIAMLGAGSSLRSNYDLYAMY